MDNPQEKVFAILDDLNIEYQIINHPAVFTAEEGLKLNIPLYGDMSESWPQKNRHFISKAYEPGD